MKHLTIKSPTHYGKLEIYHSILYDGVNVLSFEKGIFQLYDNSYLNDREIVTSQDLPEIDILKYNGVKLINLSCFEAIEQIYKWEGMELSTGRLYKYIKLGIILLILLMTIFIIGVIVGLSLDDTKKELYQARLERINDAIYIFK